MDSSVPFIDEIAEALSTPDGIGRVRSGIKPADSPILWHEIALALFARGKHREMRIALDEYGAAFNTRPIVIRDSYVFGRIGEGASVFGTLAHLQRMGKLSVKPVLFCQGAANPAYIRLWMKYFDIVTSVETLKTRYGDIPQMRVGFLPTPDGSFHHVGDAYCLARQMDGATPLLALSDEEIERGRETLSKLGMPKQAWFVCLHARSPHYMANAKVDDRHNEYRNSEIRTFAKAAHRIAEHGGWVVRIGAHNVERMPAWPNAIDLPHRHPWEDWLDLFVMGGCRFFLGDSSGPSAVAATFSRPCVGVNMQLGSPTTWMDLHTVKLYRREGRLLTLSEAIEAGMLMRQTPPPDDIEVVDNTADEIGAMVGEFLEGTLISHDRQERYVSCFPSETQRLLGLASPAFLEQHEEVLK